MTVVCVTGASGKAGRAVVRDLVQHDYWVQAVDLVQPAEDIGVPVLPADLTDYGQAVEVLSGADAVIHLANIPAPGLRPPSRRRLVRSAPRPPSPAGCGRTWRSAASASRR